MRAQPKQEGRGSTRRCVFCFSRTPNRYSFKNKIPLFPFFLRHAQEKERESAGEGGGDAAARARCRCRLLRRGRPWAWRRAQGGGSSCFVNETRFLFPKLIGELLAAIPAVIGQASMESFTCSGDACMVLRSLVVETAKTSQPNLVTKTGFLNQQATFYKGNKYTRHCSTMRFRRMFKAPTMKWTLVSQTMPWRRLGVFLPRLLGILCVCRT